MKNLLVLAMVLVFIGGKSQTDSLPRIKFTGIQFDQQGITNFNGFTLDRQQMMSYVNDDPLLTADFSDYSSWTNNTFVEYNGSIGLKAFGTFTKKRKYAIDVFAGIYYGGSSSYSRSYFKTTFDTVNTYVGTNGKKLYEVNRNQDDYVFSLSSNQVIVPVGISINTNKQKRFWVSAGFSLAPGLRINYRYLSSNYLVTSTFITDDTGLQANYYGQGPTPTKFKPISHNQRKIDQTGFVGYVSLPFSANMRISKKINFLKHLNATVTFSPAYYATFDKIVGFNQSIALVSNFGLRYNL